MVAASDQRVGVQPNLPNPTNVTQHNLLRVEEWERFPQWWNVASHAITALATVSQHHRHVRRSAFVLFPRVHCSHLTTGMGGLGKKEEKVHACCRGQGSFRLPRIGCPTPGLPITASSPTVMITRHAPQAPTHSLIQMCSY